MKIRLDLTYDGSDFSGWQKQKHTDQTIQNICENILSKLLNEEIHLYASGRTDQGVHARQQTVHFSTTADLSKYNFSHSLNCLLPSSIRLNAAYIAPDDFHARFSAKKKEYRYYFYISKWKDPFLERYNLHLNKMINLDLLNKYAEIILGKHDFTSFQNTGTKVSSTIRHIYQSTWCLKENQLSYHIVGNGFLKQMVRNLVGAMIDYATKNKTPNEFRYLLDNPQTQKHFPLAPSKALFLHHVYYPEDLDNKCRKL